MDSPIPEKKGICTYSLLGLAFEKGKAMNIVAHSRKKKKRIDVIDRV